MMLGRQSVQGSDCQSQSRRRWRNATQPSAGWHSDRPSYSEYRNVLETVWKPLGGPIEASTSSTSRPFPVDWAEGFGGLGPIVHVSFSFSPSGTR
ncbi:hypothetical protein BO83DRAFT_42246 [Aspergillus eucalypticola CBS 122712]|uniref:Uncharacterized protein n=1 Tax=Aspergillus eucalypticola (strain CBS 122712 / IBT 29274) TaxID=1448314 RepID=A0A317VHD9_ASPEC|nr:uncharacterized protein BO83DRAFT_42246 [Aspergillus eucalypticola CBS 122712]PWY72879.1 hypothetical protein BO83DRAFT_42246 [Aspergillus eucalypticola CBS 122712]